MDEIDPCVLITLLLSLSNNHRSQLGEGPHTQTVRIDRYIHINVHEHAVIRVCEY